MAKVRRSLDYEHRRDVLRNGHLDGYAAEAETIAQFLLKPSVQERIGAALFETEDEHLQNILSNAAG